MRGPRLASRKPAVAARCASPAGKPPSRPATPRAPPAAAVGQQELAADTQAPNPQVAQLGSDEDGTLPRQALRADQEAREAHRCAGPQKPRVIQDCSARRLPTVKPKAAKACATRLASA